MRGCTEHCLHCWILPDFKPAPVAKSEERSIPINIPTNHQYWYDEGCIKEIDLGNLPVTYKDYISDGFHLVILPISRVATHKSIFLPDGIMIYPESRLDLKTWRLDNPSVSELKEIAPQELSVFELSSLQSQLSGISIDDLNEFPLIVMPIKFQWDTFFDYTHEKHLELISILSEMIASKCLNFIKYMNCEISHTPSDTLPSLPSQTSINNMSATLFVNANTNGALLLSGAVFHNQITKGLGLVLSQPEWNDFPSKGEVSILVEHALSLYAQIIQTESATSRFVQVLSLLEFLAYPTEYKGFKEVKKIIARYIIQDTHSPEYQQLLKRFEELTGKKDETTGEHIGLRTRIIHIGAHLEDLLPTIKERRELFKELANYVRCVIDHMIQYAHLSIEDYAIEKEKLIQI